MTEATGVNKAVFLDRDDTIIEDTGYIDSPEQVKLLEGSTESLRELQELGYKLIVVTNQSGVARGIFSEKTLSQIHDRMSSLLESEGVKLDKIYYCPYHPEGVVPKYRRESDLRKPNPGMFLKASEEMDIDLLSSWAIGDRTRDIKAGMRAGCRTILINKPKEELQIKEFGVRPDFTAVNIREAVNIIKKYSKAQKAEQPQEQIAVETEEKSTQAVNKEIWAGASERQVTELLCEISERLRDIQRREKFEEFSTMRLLAGVVQMAVLFCMLLSIWFLLSPSGDNQPIYLSLGFALVLQVMSLTFYMMQNRR